MRASAGLALRREATPAAWPVRGFLAAPTPLEDRVAALSASVYLPTDRLSHSRWVRRMTIGALALLVCAFLGMRTDRGVATAKTSRHFSPATNTNAKPADDRSMGGRDPEVAAAGREAPVAGKSKTPPRAQSLLARHVPPLAERRAKSMSRFKQIAIAWHLWHDEHKHFPVQANYDADGKPLLNWRVHILLNLDQKDLYQRFKLDEPWDSPHNLQLLDLIPAECQASTDQQPASTNTTVVSTVGEAFVLFGREGRGVRDFTDGNSKSILLIETRTNIPWTKPEDLVIDCAKPRARIEGLHPGLFISAFGDGSVQAISDTVSDERLLKPLTINVGKVIDPEM
ncbi:MAG: DUF1559 domain-containing protein [Pirellulales bacterium]|nr:DUF1559 domain-containing protein [Pirellulales bacterium]